MPDLGRSWTAATRPAGPAWSVRSAGPWSARAIAPGAPSPHSRPVHSGPARDQSASQSASRRLSRTRRTRNPVPATVAAASTAAVRAARASCVVRPLRLGWFQPSRPVGPHHADRAGPGTTGRVGLALALRPAVHRARTWAPATPGTAPGPAPAHPAAGRRVPGISAPGLARRPARPEEPPPRTLRAASP